MTDLAGRVAVVTGASSGIGHAAARALAAEGMTVVAVARRAERLADLAAATEGVSVFAADVTDDDQVRALAEHVAEQHGACHLLVNNAGAPGGHQLRDPSDVADIAAVMDVNFMGAVRCMAAFAALLEASAPSQVINVASVAGKIGVGSPGYSASKFALIGLTEAMGPDWRTRGVVVTQLNPGFIQTEGFPQANLTGSPATRRLVAQPVVVAKAIVAVAKSRAAERTVPRWYRPAVVLRHTAAPLVRSALRRL